MFKHICTALTFALVTGSTALAADAEQSKEIHFETECLFAQATLSTRVYDPARPDEDKLRSYQRFDLACRQAVPTLSAEEASQEMVAACRGSSLSADLCASLATDSRTLLLGFEGMASNQLPDAISLRRPSTDLGRLVGSVGLWADHRLSDGTAEQWFYILQRGGDFTSASAYFYDDAAELSLACEANSGTLVVGRVQAHQGEMQADWQIERFISCESADGLRVEHEVYHTVPMQGYALAPR